MENKEGNRKYTPLRVKTLQMLGIGPHALYFHFFKIRGGRSFSALMDENLKGGNRQNIRKEGNNVLKIYGNFLGEYI